MKLPNKKYSIIYADPPWSYRDKRDKHPRISGGATVHYETMTTNDIKNLEVEKIADKNCMLFLWVTFPNLQDGLDTIKAWGFEYKTIAFNWIKYNTNEKNLFFGIGYYTKSNSEICLIGVKGKPIKISDNVSSIVFAPKEEHSRKPPEVRSKIIELCGDIPRIELFARQKYKGWDNWGNEFNKTKNNLNEMFYND